MSELAPRSELLDVLTGEIVEATPVNAARALAAIKQMEARLRDVKAAVTAYVIEESQRQGTKTFHTPDGDLVLTGGASTVIDPHILADQLREAGCPEDVIGQVVKEEVVTTYKVDRNRLRSMTSANDDYKAAAELATSTVENTYRASLK